jgi:hypothetical protein
MASHHPSINATVADIGLNLHEDRRVNIFSFLRSKDENGHAAVRT